MTPERAAQQLDEACYEAMGILLSLHEHGLLPLAGRDRIDAVVLKWREALPIVRAKVAAVAADDLIDSARSRA
jgi:hypothetical protein